jgi:DNA-binding PadR family transcriptional regulator
MNRSWDEILPIEEHILELGLKKAEEGQPTFYAYGMACELEATNRTPTLSSNGTMYKALRRMETIGWLKSEYEAPEVAAAEGKRPRRTLYQVTAEGREAFENAPRAVVSDAASPVRAKAPAPTRRKAGVRVGQVVPFPLGAGP